MDKAYTADYKLITTQQAVKGKKYFCPICNGALHFYPGTKNTPHFRHGKGVPEEVKANCELYSQGLGGYNMYNQEFIARQKVRLVLYKKDEDYTFHLKFPLIQKSFVNAQLNNIYFTYHCQEIPEFQFNTVRLLPVRSDCVQKVSLLGRYTINCTNERYEKALGLRVSGIYEPFNEGPLIFKEFQGQFISIPYRRVTLSGRFFILSATPIPIHLNLERVNEVYLNKFYLYELIMPIEFSEELSNWFTRILCYTLLPATCHLDILASASFKKIGTTIEVNSQKSAWLVTNIGERYLKQRVILVQPNNKRQVVNIPSNGVIVLNLTESGDYLLYVDQAVTEMLTLRYNPTLEHNRNFIGQAQIDKTEALFTIKDIYSEKIEFETDLAVSIHNETDINYEMKYGGIYSFYAPIRIDFPTLWSISIIQPVQILESNGPSFETILRFYEQHLLYTKMICLVEDIQRLELLIVQSEFPQKNKILYYIRRFGIRVPKPIYEITQEMKYIQ